MRLFRDDFAQVALLSVWDTLQDYDDHEDMPIGKLAKMRARRAVINEWRRQFGPRRKKQAHDNAVPFEEFLHDSDYEPRDESPDSNFTERIALWDALDERLRQLPLRWAAMIRPYFYDGLTLSECAKKCGYTTERMWQILKASRLPARDKLAQGSITNPKRHSA